ncbi:MAG: transposase [Sedimentisphaerales bacterium]
MGNTLGYMVTFTTYGTWLQGDKRGFVKDGETLEGCEELEQANKKAIKGDEVRLKKREREIARTAILQEAERIGETILALSVWSSHVHIVIKEGGKPADKVVNRFKTAAYYALRERGFKGKVWTRSYDSRFCFDEAALKNRIKYVEGQET